VDELKFLSLGIETENDGYNLIFVYFVCKEQGDQLANAKCPLLFLSVCHNWISETSTGNCVSSIKTLRNLE
jgi:hypothetical protein